MTSAEARQVILAALQAIAPDVDVEHLDPDQDMRTAVDLDSVDFLSMLEQVSVACGIDIAEADYDQVRSLQGMTAYLVRASGPDR